MPGPTINEVHYPRPLASYALDYAADQDYLSDKVAPVIQSDFKSNKYWVFPKEYYLSALATPRAPGTESQGGQYHLQTADYNCEIYAFHYDLADQIRANFDTVWSADQSHACR